MELCGARRRRSSDDQLAVRGVGWLDAVVVWLNTPGKKNASFLTGSGLPESSEQWLTMARRREGSWWLYWSEWLAARSGAKKKASATPGSRHYPPGAPAPGTYVLRQSA